MWRLLDFLHFNKIKINLMTKLCLCLYTSANVNKIPDHFDILCKDNSLLFYDCHFNFHSVFMIPRVIPVTSLKLEKKRPPLQRWQQNRAHSGYTTWPRPILTYGHACNGSNLITDKIQGHFLVHSH